MKINDYIFVSSFEKANEILSNNKNTAIIAGGAWMKFSNKKLDAAIDLRHLELEYITETDKSIVIGSMCTLRQVEKSKLLAKYTNSIIADSIKTIMGVQIRNIATIGGTIAGKYGFSDLLTPLLALDCSVKIHGKPLIKLEDFFKNKHEHNDIIENIQINKNEVKGKFYSLKKTSNDFSIINVAVLKSKDGIFITVGARPKVAEFAYSAMEFVNDIKKYNELYINKCAEIAVEELSFGSNSRASKDYRKEICNVYIKRGLLEVTK